MRSLACFIIAICLGACSYATGEEDDTPVDIGLLVPDVTIATVGGLSIQAPALEQLLKAPNAGLWIKLLRDSRSILTGNQRALPPDEDDFRVNDLVYYFYAKYHDYEGDKSFSRFPTRDVRDKLINRLILKLEKEHPKSGLFSVLSGTRLFGFESPVRTLEVFLRSLKDGDYDLYVATLTGDALAATEPADSAYKRYDTSKEKSAREDFKKLCASIRDVPEMRLYEKNGRITADVEITRNSGEATITQRNVLRFSDTRLGWRIDRIEKEAPKDGEKKQKDAAPLKK